MGLRAPQLTYVSLRTPHSRYPVQGQSGLMIFCAHPSRCFFVRHKGELQNSLIVKGWVSYENSIFFFVPWQSHPSSSGNQKTVACKCGTQYVHDLNVLQVYERDGTHCLPCHINQTWMMIHACNSCTTITRDAYYRTCNYANVPKRMEICKHIAIQSY